MAEAALRLPPGRRPDHRRVLRLDAGPPRRDGRGAPGRRGRPEVPPGGFATLAPRRSAAVPTDPARSGGPSRPTRPPGGRTDRARAGSGASDGAKRSRPAGEGPRCDDVPPGRGALGGPFARRAAAARQPASVLRALREALPCLDPDREPVLGRRQRARELRRVDAGRVVGEVEVDRVRPVLVGLQIEVAAGAVGLGAARRVEERQEQGPAGVRALQLVRREPARLAVELELERPGPMRRPEPTVRRRDLEGRRLVAGVRVQRQAFEDEVDVDRVVRQAGERVALVGRDRAADRPLEELVLLGPEALRSRRRSRAARRGGGARARPRGRGPRGRGPRGRGPRRPGRSVVLQPCLLRRCWRRGWDSNPRTFRSTVFKTVAIDRSATSPPVILRARRIARSAAVCRGAGSPASRFRAIRHGDRGLALLETRTRQVGVWLTGPTPVVEAAPRPSRSKEHTVRSTALTIILGLGLLAGCAGPACQAPSGIPNGTPLPTPDAVAAAGGDAAAMPGMSMSDPAAAPASDATAAAAAGAIAIEAFDLGFKPASCRSRGRAPTRSPSTTPARSPTTSRSRTARRSSPRPGATATGPVTSRRRDSTFMCSIPGHAAAGMKGAVTSAAQRRPPRPRQASRRRPPTRPAPVADPNAPTYVLCDADRAAGPARAPSTTSTCRSSRRT